MGWAKNEKTLRITVSVFLCTFELTALLLKGFHLPLHDYTLAYTRIRVVDISCVHISDVSRVNASKRVIRANLRVVRDSLMYTQCIQKNTYCR